MRQTTTHLAIFSLVIGLGCQGTNSYLASTSAANIDLDDKTNSKTVRIGNIDWYVDYDAALKVAKQKNLPLWLHFGENPG